LYTYSNTTKQALEESIEPNSTIASLSLGAERKFSFKHKQTKQTISLVLEHGSIIKKSAKLGTRLALRTTTVSICRILYRHRINLNPRLIAYAKSNYIINRILPSDHHQTGYNFVGLISVLEYYQSVDT